MLAAGRDTVLGDAAAEEQLFLTADYEDIALADISGEACSSIIGCKP